MFASQSYNVAPNADDNGGGGGGGGGGGSNLFPSGMVMAWATNTAPAGFLLCNGATYLRTAHSRLFGVIGNNFNTGSGFSQTPINSWFVFNNGIGQANITGVNNYISVGDIIVISNTTAVSGTTLNGIPLVITSAPAIGVSAGQITFTANAGTLSAGQQTIGQTTGYAELISFNVPDLRLKNPIGTGAGINFATSGGSATTTLTITNLPPHSHTLWRGGAEANKGSTNADSIGTPNVDTGLAAGGNIYRATDTPTSGSRVQQVGQDGTGQTAFSTRNPYLAMNYVIKD